MLRCEAEGRGIGLQQTCVDNAADACGLRGLDNGFVLGHTLADLRAGDQQKRLDALQRGGQGIGLAIICLPNSNAEIGGLLRRARKGDDLVSGGGFEKFCDGEAAELARERLLRPARDLAQDSQRQVEAAGERVADGVEQAGDLLWAERDLAAGWIQKNPWAAVGLAFGAGVILSELYRSRR